MFIDETGKLIAVKEVLDSGKKIIFFGASIRNIDIIKQWDLNDRVLFFVDSDVAKVGNYLDGYKIHAREEIADYKDVCCVLSTLIEYVDEVLSALRSYGVERCLFCVPEKFDVASVRRDNIEVLQKEKAYKYIHIFPNNKFTQPFYRMIEDNFNIEEHLFIIDYIPGNEKYGELHFAHKKTKQNGNVLVIDDVHRVTDFIPEELRCNTSLLREKMERLFESADKIIFHSMFRGNVGKELQDGLADKMAEKLAWIFWGGEENSSKYEVVKKVKYAYAPKAKIPQIYQVYGIWAQEFLGGYAYASINRVNKRIVGDEKENSVRILLGHSAWGYGNHLYGFTLLEKYRNEKIKIYCPLSYGEEGYSDIVIERGQKMFGDKFIPMTKFMELEEYSDFLNTIDVALLPMTFMAAATTLTYLNVMGKKIYMSREMISCYLPSGIHAEDMEKIRELTLEEFAAPPVHKGIGLQEINEKIVHAWKKVFNDGEP